MKRDFSLLYFKEYCQTSNISRTKHQNWNVSDLILQLSLPNPLKPSVKSRMKMQLEQRIPDCMKPLFLLNFQNTQNGILCIS